MTSHLSNSQDERAKEEAGALAIQLLSNVSTTRSESTKARLRLLVGQIYHRILHDPNLAISNYRLAYKLIRRWPKRCELVETSTASTAG